MWRWVCVALALVGCASAPARPTAAPDPMTQLVAADDLPQPYRLQLSAMPWRIYPGIAITPAVAYYEIVAGADAANEVGHIAIVHYPDAPGADEAYAAIRREAELGKAPSPLALGEDGSQSWPSADWNASDVVFRRCNSVVHLSLQERTLDLLVPVAQRIHDRLQRTICAR
jgi:hypothetical protein